MTQYIKKYKDYQYVNIYNNGSINALELESHTLKKFNIAKSVANECTSVLDAGCSLGGIGLSLSFLDNVKSVTLNNITEYELNVAKEIHNELLKNKNNPQHNKEILFSSDNIITLEKEYDLTLYFALIHHILKSETIDFIINMIYHQTKKYTVVEVPLKGDTLLNNVIRDSGLEDPWSDRYVPLINADSFIKYLSGKFQVLSVHHIDYGSDKLIRHAFVCKKI